MRVVTVMAVLLLGGAATLEAQHRFQFEIGGFASFTRFDRALLLDNQIGGGGRIGFWITDWLGIEGDDWSNGRTRRAAEPGRTSRCGSLRGASCSTSARRRASTSWAATRPWISTAMPPGASAT